MFVLVAYKTEPCKRAARLCRQGYACPNYHNSKDRRRSPKNWKYRYNRKTNHRTTPFRVDTARTGHLPGLSRDNTFPVHTKMCQPPVKEPTQPVTSRPNYSPFYRSTPCPLVKSNDEWGDPSVCEHLDNCGYCHTRTEQQFHPEVRSRTVLERP